MVIDQRSTVGGQRPFEINDMLDSNMKGTVLQVELYMVRAYACKLALQPPRSCHQCDLLALMPADMLEKNGIEQGHIQIRLRHSADRNDGAVHGGHLSDIGRLVNRFLSLVWMRSITIHIFHHAFRIQFV